MTPGVVAVIGATGHEGGAAARALLAGGASVRALVRDPGWPAPQALVELGAEIVPADLQQPRSVADGMTVIDAAARAGVTHFVYTST